MRRQSLYLSNAEIYAFFRRIDKNDCSKISFNEFKAYLLPDVAELRWTSKAGISFSRKPTNSQGFEKEKYRFKSYETSTQLAPKVIDDYKLVKGSPYKNTPYLSSEPRELSNYSSNVSNYHHHPQISQYESLKLQNNHPPSTTNFIGNGKYPLLEKPIYASYRKNSIDQSNPLKEDIKTLYFPSDIYPQSGYQLYIEKLKAPETLNRQDLKSTPTSDIINRKPYYEELIDKKYVYAKDLESWPKSFESNFGKTPGPSSSTNKKILSDLTPQKESPAVGRLDDWKMYSRNYNENYVKYGPEKTPWNPDKIQNDPTNMDLLTFTTNIRTDILMNSSILKNPKLEKFNRKIEDY